MTIQIGIINQSKDPTITTETLISIGDVLSAQWDEDVCSEYDSAPDAKFSIFSSEKVMGLGTWPCYIQDELDDPEAEAYHTVTELGSPILRVGWNIIKASGGTLTGIGTSLSSAASHEFLETAFDKYCDYWFDIDEQTEGAKEVCDPVQGNTYLKKGVAVSNFVLETFFSDEQGIRYDFLGVLTKPKSVAREGYMSVRRGGPSGRIHNVFGEGVKPEMIDHKNKYGRRVRTAKHRARIK